MRDMSINLGGIAIKNPIISAAGPVAGTAKHIKNCADAGFGAVVTKTASYFGEFQRYPRPRYYVFDHRVTAREPHGHGLEEFSWMHTEHNSVYPPDKFAQIIRESAAYCKERDCLLIGSFAGAGLTQWEETAVRYVEAGARALELNFCCPYPQVMSEKSGGCEHQIGQTFADNPDLGVAVIKRLKELVDVPLYPKMPPSARRQIQDIARKYTEAGAAGITLYANAMVLKIDIETAEPLGYGAAIGGSHGHMMDSLADVAKLSKELPGISIMAGRGARYWSDAIEFLMAGATGVQFAIAVMFNGLGYVKTMLASIDQWLERKGYTALSEVQGLALPKIYRPAEIRDKVKPLYAKVDGGRCVACGKCEDVCWYDAAALKVKRGKGAARITRENCVGCAICEQVCPVGAITLHERTDAEYLKALASAHPDLVPEIFA
jgi:dihydropyrimidine dehydrogenase (NAD+) subunit PreA